MQFRVRPNSKKSLNNDGSYNDFSTVKSLAPIDFNPRPLNSRLQQLQNMFGSFQQLNRRQRQSSNASFIQLQKRLDKVEYKTFSAEQDLRQLNEIREMQPIRENPNKNFDDSSKNEIMLLKQVIFQEKEANKENMKHQNSIIQQLSIKQMRAEQEFRQSIAQHRMQYQYRLTGQNEDLRQIQGLKTRKIQQQYEMIKGVISNAERKIYQELQRKIRNQTVVRDYIEGKLGQLKQELAVQQKQTLSSEAKFSRQTKQSLQSLYGLITNVKKELSEQLSQTQKVTANSIKKLIMSLDNSRQKVNGEIKQMSSVQIDLNNEMVELRSFMTSKLEENRQIMSEFEEMTMDRLDNRGSRATSQHTVDGQRFSHFQKEINQWKSITEQKNLNVFKQISATIKALKLQWRKENDELVSEVSALNDTIKTVRKTGPTELKKNIQAIITIFNNEFDVLSDELQNLTEMIALSKRQGEKIMKDEIAKMNQQIIEETKAIINQKNKEGIMYTDKAVARNDENLKLFVNREMKLMSDASSRRLQKIQNEMNQFQATLKRNSLNTTAQLEDFSLKLKTFNDNYKGYLQEQRKQDVRKRLELQEAMRKNASNLMDITYKKSQLLVQGLKKDLEMIQMKQKMENQQALQNAKAQIKKEIQLFGLQWQKQLAASAEKLSKQRENSQEILHEQLQQAISNAKKDLMDNLGNFKLQLNKTVNDFEAKQAQRQAKLQQKMADLIKREQILMKFKQTVEKELPLMSSKQQLNTTKLILQQRFNQLKQQIKLQFANLQDNQKRQGEQKTLIEQEESKKKQEKLQQLIKENESLQIKNKQISEKIDGIDKKLMQIQNNTDKEKDNKLLNEKIDNIDNKIKEMQTNPQKEKENKLLSEKIDSIDKRLIGMQTNTERQKENKLLFEKINSIDKKIIEMQNNSQKEKQKSKEGDKVKIGEQKLNTLKNELQTSINKVNSDVQAKNKLTQQKLEKINKSISQFKVQEDKFKGQDRKQQQQNLIKLKEDLQKQIKALQSKIQSNQESNNQNDQQQQIRALQKSLNKLQAMIFSQQAKNKAIFDRLTEDLNKVSENLMILTDSIRQ